MTPDEYHWFEKGFFGNVVRIPLSTITPMPTDARQYPATTQNEQAARHLEKAIDSFLRKRLDSKAHLNAALEEDSHCTLANTLQGLMLSGLRKNSMNDMVRQSLHLAQQHCSNATPREQGYVAALEYTLEGNREEATRCYEAIVRDHPTDLLALSMAQTELFWLGQMPRAENLSASVAAHWSAELHGYPEYLAIRAFDLEETGAFAEAEKTGRESVSLRSDNVWGTHAVAHVMLMQQRVDEGLQWLDGLSEHWSEVNQLKFHLWWHQCLFYLEAGDHPAALAIHDQWLRNHEQPLTEAMPDFYLDLQNGASLLWRLESAGVDVGDRWFELAEAVMPVFRDMTGSFTSAHIAMIFQAAGMHSEFDELLSCMKQFIADTDNALTQGYESALAAAQACRSYRLGNHADVLEILMPMRKRLVNMGGSHAQQEVFFQMMFDSARRLKRTNDMQGLSRELELQGFQAMSTRAAYSL